MKTDISAWPTDDKRISASLVDVETGRVLRTKETKWKRSAKWWKERGFSFNGRLTAKANVKGLV